MSDRPTPHPVRAVMVMRGVTIAETAARMEVHPLTLQRWIARTHGAMPAARREQLAGLLEWPAEDLGELFHHDAPRPRHHHTEDRAHAR